MTPPAESFHKQRPAARWRWRMVIGLLLVLLVTALFARQIASWGARQAAARSLGVGTISPAERWLAWAERLDPRDYRTDLLRAACYRDLGQHAAWERALEAAQDKGAAHAAAQLESELGRVRWGESDELSARDLEALLAADASPREAVTAVVHGLLAKAEVAEARQMLETWSAKVPDQAHMAYLSGLCLWSSNQRESAQSAFERALDEQPGHELSRSSLGRLLEQQERLAEALPHYADVAAKAPHRTAAQVDLARVLRKLGRLAEARVALPPPAPKDVTAEVAIELAEREYESGNYGAARRWFERADLDGAHVADTLRAAATTCALHGDFAAAERLFARVDQAQDASRQVSELRRRLSIDPTDAVAASELRRWTNSPVTPLTKIGDPPAEQVSQLYLEHCAACHGPQGDGRGRAAIYLDPRPRNLRTDRLRLVSTQNRVASREDLERVIQRGIPGTAMPPLPKATPDQLRELAEQVKRFQRAGVRERLLAEQHGDEETPDVELRQVVAAFTTGSSPVSVPPNGPATAQSVERGRELYLQLGCHHCHGPDGAGAQETDLFDDLGRPATPRDLTDDPMKGGAEVESLFFRIRLGMPGTPHPASPSIRDEELVDLVHFCRSLAASPPRISTNHERSRDLLE